MSKGRDFMKITIEYFKDDRYDLAKKQLLDPEMHLNDLLCDYCFDDYSSAIIFNHFVEDSIKQIVHGSTWWEITFSNNNCFTGFAEECVMTIDLI